MYKALPCILLVFCLAGCGVKGQEAVIPATPDAEQTNKQTPILGTDAEAKRLTALACERTFNAIDAKQCPAYVSGRISKTCAQKKAVGVEWLAVNCPTGLELLSSWARTPAILKSDVQEAKKNPPAPSFDIKSKGGGSSWLALEDKDRIQILQQKPDIWQSPVCDDAERLAADLRSYYASVAVGSKEFNLPLSQVIKEMCF